MKEIPYWAAAGQYVLPHSVLLHIWNEKSADIYNGNQIFTMC